VTDSRHLLVIADSLAFHGPQRPEVLTDPRLYPNVCAAAIAAATGEPWRADVVARLGWTARDGWWALTKDPNVATVLAPRADALLLGVGQMDHLPAALPTYLREGIAYLRPGGLRRRVRAVHQQWGPRVIRVTGGRLRQLPQEATDTYLARIVQAVRLLAGDVPVVLLGPSPHAAPAYPSLRHHAPAVAAARRWAAAHRTGFVDLDPIVQPSLDAGTGNPDGMHWSFAVHEGVGTAAARALLERRGG
jgi:hypothetical protein